MIEYGKLKKLNEAPAAGQYLIEKSSVICSLYIYGRSGCNSAEAHRKWNSGDSSV